uniref:Reelin domain-containing protein n=2 Tax=Dendroctonus ponderosae TaxID=77166 RepID=A0AAR5PFQ2_DENPD
MQKFLVVGYSISLRVLKDIDLENTMSKLMILTVLSVAASAWGYSAGAPEAVCGNMTPNHPASAQKTRFPYKVSVSSDTIKAGEETKINISGKQFKGFLAEVRDGDQAVGSFQIPADDKYLKAINCNGIKGSGATHKNKVEKSDISLTWKAPSTAGKYTVYATVALDGLTFWVAKPSGTINVV